MAPRLARRSAILVLLLALLVGWSGQALSFVTSGACVMTMDMDTSSAPTSDDQKIAAEDDPMPPCEGVALRCIGSIGCVIFVGLPQAEVAALPTPPPGDRSVAAIHDLAGLALKPELSPPIATV